MSEMIPATDEQMPNAPLNLINDVTLVGLTQQESVLVRFEIERRYSDARTLFHARIHADGEQITELKRDFAAYRAAMNPDDDAMFGDLYYRSMVKMKRRAEAAEARAARLAEALRFYADGWPSGVEWDSGTHARVALSKLETK